MEQRFTVHGRLDGLNEYTAACRSGRYAGAGVKKRNQGRVQEAIRAAGLVPMDGPVSVRITWRDKAAANHRHRDKDNIAFAKKFVMDALVCEGVIQDDSWDRVDGFEDEFVDDEEGSVEVLISERRKR